MLKASSSRKKKKKKQINEIHVYPECDLQSNEYPSH